MGDYGRNHKSPACFLPCHRREKKLKMEAGTWRRQSYHNFMMRKKYERVMAQGIKTVTRAAMATLTKMAPGSTARAQVIKPVTRAAVATLTKMATGSTARILHQLTTHSVEVTAVG